MDYNLKSDHIRSNIRICNSLLTRVQWSNQISKFERICELSAEARTQETNERNLTPNGIITITENWAKPMNNVPIENFLLIIIFVAKSNNFEWIENYVKI